MEKLKILGSQYLDSQFPNIFKFLDQPRCCKFSEDYKINVFTELSFSKFVVDYIKFKKKDDIINGNVVNALNWIGPVSGGAVISEGGINQ